MKIYEKFDTFSKKFGHHVEYFFTYHKFEARHWPGKKDPVKFRAKLRSGEGVEHECFCDIRLIGMYILGGSSQMQVFWHHYSSVQDDLCYYCQNPNHNPKTTPKQHNTIQRKLGSTRK